MRVAFTTATGVNVDRNFRNADDFTVWDILPTDAFYVSSVAIRAHAGSEEDRIAARAEALSGCTLLCTHDINGPSKAKLASRQIQVLKLRKETPVEEVIEKLQGVLRGNPPPWIKKALTAGFSDADVHH
jgi:nitrogen fixation protein NifX